ncbi:MAG TPA: hypothetical protein PK707_06645 [Candidatus Syntrophosphaera thermopropionivorans]|mgnify:FL=1|jgi:hypothetical protein|nr:hypothetical protein [Candidatus Syntrophosphaera sp.]MBP7932433.1 hypothetical protein [Candidatus Syntrophosphaera sp.]HQF82516.1 hypothetical protein [Candidatus Syntrophosphaera thermopropionivorans]HQH47098.1 hypothetical protein [Candidatus Syntrophosphaera thermopropionivorans]
MKAIYTYDDEHMGKSYIVIPKIREISKVLGSVVITFDNGDKRTLAVDDPDAAIQQMLEAIENFYS